MIGYPFYTNLYADRVQSRLRNQFASEELREDYVECREVGLASDACQIEDGDSLTRIEIPDIQVDVVVVEGVGASAPARRRRALPEHAAAVRGRQRGHRRAPHDLRAAVP